MLHATEITSRQKENDLRGLFIAALYETGCGSGLRRTATCPMTRQDQQAFEIMVQHAAQIGANAIIGVRYDANDVTDGVTEVLCYGTAVVEPVKPNIIAGPAA